MSSSCEPGTGNGAFGVGNITASWPLAPWSVELWTWGTHSFGPTEEYSVHTHANHSTPEGWASHPEAAPSLGCYIHKVCGADTQSLGSLIYSACLAMYWEGKGHKLAWPGSWCRAQKSWQSHPGVCSSPHPFTYGELPCWPVGSWHDHPPHSHLSGLNVVTCPMRGLGHSC